MIPSKATCNYKVEYESRKEMRLIEVKFQCTEEALETGFCIFHDEYYFAKHPEIVADRINSKIQESIENAAPLYCIGYNIPSLELTGEIKAEVYFSRAIFHGDVVLQDLVFHENVHFTFAKFSKELMVGYVNFREAYFNECRFDGDVSLIRSNFEGGADFSDSSFNKLEVVGVNFKGYFELAASDIFSANFEESEFKDFTVFSHCELGHISLSDCNFQNSLTLVGAQIYGRFLMENSKVLGELRLWNAHFANQCTIESVILGGRNGFEDVVFSDVVEIDESYFNTANFGRTVFHGITAFRRTRFKEAIFYETEFMGLALFLDTYFEHGENILFELEDMSHTSFSNTDISRVGFGERVRWGDEENPYKILDERRLENDPSEIDIRNVSSTYRFLRENYEYRLKYEEAGQFFKREMELKRIYSTRYSNGIRIVDKKNAVSKFFSLTSAYRYLCNYGEDYRLPIIWIVALFIVSSLYWSTALPMPATAEAHLAEPIWISSVSRTLSDVFQIRTEELTPADYLIRILSIPILGTLFVSLRRKFERRFRH